MDNNTRTLKIEKYLIDLCHFLKDSSDNVQHGKPHKDRGKSTTLGKKVHQWVDVLFFVNFHFAWIVDTNGCFGDVVVGGIKRIFVHF